MMHSRTGVYNHSGVTFLLAAGLYAFAWFALMHAMPMVSDAESYVLEARAMVGRFPALLPERPFYWPPGTAMTIAALAWPFGIDHASARGVTIVVSALNVVLARKLTEALGADAPTVRLATALALAYPPALLMSGQSYSQPYAASWLLAFAWLAVQAVRRRAPGRFALAGLALGMGCLTRPSMASVLALALLAFGIALVGPWARAAGWTARSVALAAASFVIAFVAVVAPVAIGNQRLGAGYTLSTNNARNFFIGNNPYTPHYKTPHLAQRPLESLQPEVREYLKAIYAAPNRNEAMTREALSYMAAHPGITAWRTLNRIRAFWGFDYLLSRRIASYYSLGPVGSTVLLAFEAGGYFVLMTAAIVGLFHGWRYLRREAALLPAVALAYQGPYAIAFSTGTYHFPVIGLFVPFAAAGLRFLREPGAVGRMSRWLWLALVLFALLQLEYAWHLLAYADADR